VTTVSVLSCCYCLDPLSDGDEVIATNWLVLRPEAEPHVRQQWSHIGCWRLHMTELEQAAADRLAAKRARYVERDTPEGHIS
jgi:hypothetical protein